MRAHKKHSQKAIKISLLSLSISHIIMQAAHATCATDTYSLLQANNQNCTATSTNYGSYGPSPVVISGNNSTLTLLDNTTVTIGTAGVPAIDLNSGSNNLLIAENLKINYDQQSQYWYGISINNNNKAVINQDLEIIGSAPTYSNARGINILGAGSVFELYGDLTIRDQGGDGIYNQGGTINLYKTSQISVEGFYSGISAYGGLTTFHGDTSFISNSAYAINMYGGAATFLSNVSAASYGPYFATVSAISNSALDIQKSLSVTSTVNHSIVNNDSTIKINNVSQASSGSSDHTFLYQLGNSSKTNIGSINNANSAGNFIISQSGNIEIGPGAFTSSKSSIVIKTDSNSTTNLSIGALAITNTSGQSINLSNSGTNTLNFNGSTFNSANSILTTDNTYNGTTTVNLSSVNFAKHDPLLLNTSAGTGSVNINASNTNITGTTQSGGSTLDIVLKTSDWTLNSPTNNQASFTSLSLDGQSTLKMADKAGAYNFGISGTVSNAGLIKLSDNTEIGDQLTITGDYVGNGGVIEFNTQLSGDNSATDKLVINGSASGSSALKFNNINGIGSATRTGIQVIETTSSTAQAFYLPGGYVSAGEYEYALSMRSENAQDNWYLGSALLPQPPQPPVDPTNPEPPAPLPPPSPEDYIYSPNPGSMIALQQAANTLFNSQLEDREGASTQWFTSDGKYNVWLRAYGSSNQYNALYKQLHTEGRSLATQLGVGLVSLGEREQFNLGLMAGYGRFNSDTHSRITKRKSSSELDGYSVGAYATWYKDPSEKQGFYADSWLLWNHFDNTLKLADGDKYDFKSRGVTASIEVGSHYRLMQGESINWWLQPQAQVVFEGVKADKRKDALGVTAKSGKHNVQTRLGAKTYLEVPVAISEQTQYRPYLELNWLHNTNPHSVVINDNTYHAEGARNQGEVKIGLEGNFAENGLIWADAGYISGSQQNRTVHGTLGVKFNF